MITLNKEPEGLLLRKAEIVAWLGLTEEQWDKIRPTLRAVPVPGHKKPHYAKRELREKLVDPFL